MTDEASPDAREAVERRARELTAGKPLAQVLAELPKIRFRPEQTAALIADGVMTAAEVEQHQAAASRFRVLTERELELATLLEPRRARIERLRASLPADPTRWTRPQRRAVARLRAKVQPLIDEHAALDAEADALRPLVEQYMAALAAYDKPPPPEESV